MALPLNIDVTWLNTGASYDAGELRRADTAIFGGAGLALGVHGGVVRHGDTSLAVTVGGADVVTIQPGACVVPGNAVTGTGCYRSAVQTAVTGNLSARNVTNPRIDLVVFRAMDTDVVPAHAAYTGRVEVIAGTPSGSPGVPTLPTMAVELARITVPQTGGGTATVDSSFRTYAHAIGGEMIVPSAARLPASAAKWQKARALDTGITYLWNGTAWPAVGFVDVPLGAGFTHGTDRTQCVRRDDQVTLAIHALKANPVGTVCTLAAGFRPSRTLYFLGVPPGLGTILSLSVDSSGVVTCYTGATVGVAATITFPAA